MSAYKILTKPLNTEKTTNLRDDHNKITFEVAKDANRTEIKKAVQEIFKVNIKKVHTIKVSGKKTQRGRIAGKRRDLKKAIITLMPGERIEFFEGV